MARPIHHLDEVRDGRVLTTCGRITHVDSATALETTGYWRDVTCPDCVNAGGE